MLAKINERISDRKRKAFVGIILCLLIVFALCSIWYIEPRFLHAHFKGHEPAYWVGVVAAVIWCRRFFYWTELRLSECLRVEPSENCTKFWAKNGLFH